MSRTALAALVLLAAGSSGCSLALDFEDECRTDKDCASIGAGLSCAAGLCVSQSTKGPIASALLNETCSKLYGGTPEQAVSDDWILLGALLSKTGELAADGPRIDRAIELAVAEINQVGGIFGKKLAVLSCDDGTDEKVAIPAAKHLVDVARVPAIIGAVASGVTIAVFTEVAHKAGVLMVSPSATAPSLTNLPDDGLLWRTAPSDSVQGAAIAAYLQDQKFEKIAIINRDDAYGTGLRDAITKKFCGEGGACESEDLLTRSYSDDSITTDQSNALVEVEKFNPDIVVLISFFDDGIAFLQDASDKGIRRFVLTDGTRDIHVLEEIADKELLCQAVGTYPADPSGGTFQAFAIRYKSKWGDPPGTFNAHAYDALYMLGYAVGATGKDRWDITGKDLAKQLERLTKGNPVEVGTSDWNGVIQTLRSDPKASIDLNGASGLLDFDTKTGEPKSTDIEGWRFDLSKTQVKSLGVLFSAAGTYTAPTTEVDSECKGVLGITEEPEAEGGN